MPGHRVRQPESVLRGHGPGPAPRLLERAGRRPSRFSVPMRHFAKHYRTLAVDNRDVGQSDRAKGPYSTADMADDVAGWLRGIGVSGRISSGHSLGGLIAQELALLASRPGPVARAGVVARRCRPLARGGPSVVGHDAEARGQPGRFHAADASLAGGPFVLCSRRRSRGSSSSPSGTRLLRTSPPSSGRPTRRSTTTPANDSIGSLYRRW